MKSPVLPQFKCPLIFTVTGLIALAMLGYTDNVVLLPAGLAVLFVASYLVKIRLPEWPLAIWIARIVVYIGVVQLSRTNEYPANDVGDPHSVVILGFVAASEMVIQCWRVHPAGHPPGMSLILFVGVAYLGGCFISGVDQESVIRWATPVFFVLLALSWRRLEAQTLSDPLSRRAIAWYVTALILSVIVSYGFYLVLTNDRVQLSAFAQRLIDSSATPPEAGLSDNPSLSSNFGFEGSVERVLLVKGPLSDPHLRCMAFHDFVRDQWGPVDRWRRFQHAPTTLGTPSAGTMVQVTKLHYAAGMIFYPLDAQYLDLQGQPGAVWSPSAAGPILSQALAPSTYSFCESDVSDDFLDQPVERDSLSKDLVVPQNMDPAVGELAWKTVRGKKTDDARVQALCARLDADHGYSLNYNPPSDQDILTGFILGKSAAHCEFFASALVVLLRCVHIPARYVIGYYAHEHDQAGNVIVRQRDAHAWTEAYFDGRWNTVDATPAGGRPDKLYGPVSSWDQWIGSLEDRLQLLENQVQAAGAGKIFAVVAVLVGFYLVVRLAREWLKRSATRRLSYTADRRLSTFAGRFERLLAARKVIVPDAQTWLEFLEKSEDLPIEHETAVEFVRLYYAVRFGGENDERLAQLLDAMERNGRTKETV